MAGEGFINYIKSGLRVFINYIKSKVLVAYIRAQLSAGTPLQQIKQSLTSKGWSDHDINKAIDLAVYGKRTPEVKTWEKVEKTGETIFNIFYLVRLVLALIIVIGIISLLLLLGVPWHIGIFFLIFGIAIIILQIIRVKEIWQKSFENIKQRKNL